MYQFLEKFRIVEEKIAKRLGGFVFFGLFLPEESSYKWDLVFAAPWLKNDDMDTFKIISQILNQVLKNDMMKLSRFVVLSPTDAFVRSVEATIQLKKGTTEFVNCEFNGLHFKNAFVITAQKIAHGSKEDRVAV